MTVPSSLDHVVLATPDVAATSRWITQHTGVAPSPGGPHLGMGTRNELCSLGVGRYLEIVGPDHDQPEPEAPRPFGIDERRDAAVVGWCMASDDLDSVVQRSRVAGHLLAGPLSMSRQAPHGLVSWTLAVPADDRTGGVVPFFIDWGTTDHPSVTAASGLRLDSLTATAPNADRIRKVLDALEADLWVDEGPAMSLVATVTGPAGTVLLPTTGQ